MTSSRAVWKRSALRTTCRAEDQTTGDDGIGRVAHDLDEGGPGPVADESCGEPADETVVAQQERSVPERLGRRQDPEPLELAEARAEEPGGDQQERDGRHREETPHAEACPAAEDHPAERRRRRDAEHARAQRAEARPPRPPRPKPPEKKDGLGAFAEDAGERDEAEHPESTRRLRLLDAPLDGAPHGLGVPAHPPAVPGEETHGGEDDSGADEIGPEVQQGAREAGESGRPPGSGRQRPAPRPYW